MLRTLRIRDIALIDRLTVSLEDGFTVLTGETGAGKSIIIEALNFVLGERVSRELIRTGAQKAAVEAAFALEPDAPVHRVLEELALAAEDGEIVLSRELFSTGRSVCRVNGTLISAAALKQVGDQLVDIHGQHEHQSLLDVRRHLALLDRFAAAQTEPLLAALGERYAAAHEARRALREADMDERERAHRLDLLAYQMKEIDAAQLKSGEEEPLHEQRRLLQNAQAILDALESSAAALSGDEGALGPLSAAMRAMAGVAQYSGEYAELSDRLRDGYYAIEDISYALRDLRAAFSFDPGALEQIEDRLETIAALKRKYGADIDEILRYRASIGDEYDALQNAAQRREALTEAYGEALAAYDGLAGRLSDIRRGAAEQLSARLSAELAGLGMPHARFGVQFSRLDGEAPSARGVDGVEFLFSANRGEPLKPLSRVASGGELSRVMLALKCVFSDGDGIDTMVFDEIDAGISGQVGNAVAQKLRQIASGHQVLCITHLPQIAASAHAQFHVFKQEIDGKTVSSLTRLDEAGRCRELARIMGSRPDDPVALRHARQLLLDAQAAAVS